MCTDYGVGVGVADRAHEFIFSLSWFVELFCYVYVRAWFVKKKRGVCARADRMHARVGR